MALKEIFSSIAGMFDREKADYAVIGAFALYAYGYIRATRDLDFVTRVEFRARVVAFLESLGFETLHNSEAFSNHHHPVGGARVDMMYIDGDTAERIFGKAEKRLLFENLKIPVVHPEHLIAMKLFAARNDETRRLRDLADIKEVLRSVDIDKQRLRQYFSQFGMDAYYTEVTGRIDGD